MDNPKLWVYWNSDTTIGYPAIIEVCLESIFKRNPDAILLDDEKVVEMGGEHILEVTEGRHVTKRADLLRLWLLKEFGGAWLDADHLCFRAHTLLKPLKDPEVDFVTRWSMAKYTNNAIASRPHGVVATEAYETAFSLLATANSSNRLGYLIIGPTLITKMGLLYQDKIHVLPGRHYAPVQKNKAIKLLISRSNEQHCKPPHWNRAAVAQHLAHNVVRRVIDWDRDRLLSGNEFLCFLARRALGVVE